MIRIGAVPLVSGLLRVIGRLFGVSV